MSATRSPWSLVPIVGPVVVTWLLLHRVVWDLVLDISSTLPRLPVGPHA